MTKVFIDGSAGTTGLRIYDRLSSRRDIELISLAEDKRKDVEARKSAINAADAQHPDGRFKESRRNH